MAYRVEWHEHIDDDLQKLSKDISKKIIKRVAIYLAKDPINLGETLTGQFAGQRRYRFGDYRIIYVLDIEAQIMKVLTVGHRKDIYKTKRVEDN